MNNVLRGMLGYLMLVVLVRLTGKRLGSQITPFDTVIIFFLGGAVLTPTIADERSTTSAVMTAAGVALMFVLVGWLKQKSTRWANFFDGTPLTLLEKGNLQSTVLNGMGLSETDVMAAARAKGLSTLDEIDYAILERNGQISIVQLPKQ